MNGILSLVVNPAITQFAVMATAEPDTFTWLLNLGTAGIWLVCYMTGLVHGKPEVDYLKKQVDDLNERLDQKEQIIAALRQELTGRTIPALARVAGVMANYPQQVQQVTQSDQLLAQTLSGLLERVEHVERTVRDNEH